MATNRRRAPVTSVRAGGTRARVASGSQAAGGRRFSPRLLALIAGGAALVVAAVIIIGNMARGGDSFAASGGGGTASVAAPGAEFPASARVKGSADAPVTIVEYYDLQCPNCANWEATVAPLIEQQYIDTGKVRLEVREFPFLGNESTRAALATECAGEQGQFWQFRDALFRNQRGENQGRFSDANLKAFAAKMGMDANALGACMDSGRYADRIQSDLSAGKAAGVTGTPAFLINGRLILGNLPFTQFKAAIDQALATAGA
jgi:protein-disulfide isomerase